MAIKNKKAELKARQNEMLGMLKDMKYNAVKPYIQNNVNTKEEMQDYLVKLTKIVLYILKED